MPKFPTVILATLLVGTNAWWLYKVIDLGVTATYTNQELYETQQRVATLAILTTPFIKGTPKRDAEKILQTLFPSEQPFEKEGALHTTWLSLQLSFNGRVVAVETNMATNQ